MKQKKILQTIFPILLAAFLFSLLLGFLYRYDNKYTHKGLQSIAGILVLSEKDFQNQDVYYLTKGWQLYPGVLLTPEDFADGQTPDAYMQTVTIGQHSNFASSSSSQSTSGSATYHLTLALPENECTYTLVLPEIYSAYRLYINDKEMASVGIPESEGFTEQISRKSVTFTSSGRTELFIAVSNRSHFSSGITYPPVFGLSDAVEKVEDIRFMLGVITFVLSLVCTLLSLYLLLAFRKMQETRITLFFFTSLCITVTYFYPILFLFFEISPKLWYGIELFAIYGGYLFSVMLQNEICDVSLIIKRISSGLLGLFCISGLIYGLLPTYPLWLVEAFGISATIIKILTAIYLLCCSINASLQGLQSSRILLFCTTAFGVSIIFDRLYPGWEPIVGGWPTEYGNAIMILGLGMLLGKELSEGYLFKLTFAEEKRHLTRQVAIQKEHYLELTNKIEDAIRLRHDERHHLQTLYSIYESKDYDRLGEYLSDYVLNAMPKERTILCKNLIVDAMLQYYQSLCQQENIDFSCDAALPPNLPIPDVELSILFGNLLENAYEAAKHPENHKPFVSIKAMIEDNALFLLLENSFVTPLQKKGERFFSTKHTGYGVGTQSVRSVVESYGGQCIFRDHNGVFSVSVQLLLKMPGQN